MSQGNTNFLAYNSVEKKRTKQDNIKLSLKATAQKIYLNELLLFGNAPYEVKAQAIKHLASLNNAKGAIAKFQATKQIDKFSQELKLI